MRDRHLNEEQFLRSINLIYDANAPERISHFQPTSKSTELIHALLGEKADKCFFVIAPYGSGKSLTATYFMQLVENRQDATAILDNIAERLSNTDKNLKRWTLDRTQSERKGLVIALSGYQAQLPKAIKAAINAAFERNKMGRQGRPFLNAPCTNMKEAIKLLSFFATKGVEWELDHISLIWDEFGRHIEGLVNSGNPNALDDIQTLAEFISRNQAIPFTMALLLHQTILNYAGNAPQSIKKEWKKIEGRFETIQYVDDSKELYQLIAQVMEGKTTKKPSEEQANAIWETCKQAGIDFGLDDKKAKTLLKKAYPLAPLSLYLLPRVSARVSQNERTIFTFLHQIDPKQEVTPAHLYDYFSEAMRTDTSVGGTYKQWLETESALSKVVDELDTLLLKTTCLLSLGLSGERSKAGMSFLTKALRGWNPEIKLDTPVKKLLEQKLLLYRKNTDSVSLWHGTDYDIRGRLEDEKARHEGSFDLIAFLEQQAPPEPWKPLEYNAKYAITRYFTGRYILAQDLAEQLSRDEFKDFVALSDDGLIYYVIPEKIGDLEQVRKTFSEHEAAARFVFCVPLVFKDVFQAALEAYSLEVMSKDHGLLNEDPLMSTELQQMLGDAQYFLMQTLDSSFAAKTGVSEWRHRGEIRQCADSVELRSFLSEITGSVFYATPVIKNELFVRKRVRQGLVNSRKKLVLAMLDNTGKKSFCLEGFTPDVSLFRTMLLNTKLYQPADEKEASWRFAEPEALEDASMSKVWGEIKTFFTEPSSEEKRITDLFKTLTAPPYGIRQALLPIFFTAGLKAFPAALTLTQAGEYLQDVLSTNIEDILRTPEDFRMTVHALGKRERIYLEEVIVLFGEPEYRGGKENDPLRRAFDSISAWKARVGQSALESKYLSVESKQIQRAIQRTTNPYTLLFQQVPSFLGEKKASLDECFSAICKTKEEMENISVRYYEYAVESLIKALNLQNNHKTDTLEAIRNWAETFPKDLISKFSDQVLKAFHSRLTMPYLHINLLIDSLSSLILGKRVLSWDDSACSTFSKEVHILANRLEEQIVEIIGNDPIESKTLATFVESKARSLYAQLSSMLGPKEAQALWSSISKEAV